eukprot:CAMPEP_0119344610 /NCGR_PEP_ID=MMETSP1333-20130426/107056_1 /TAXON_ID=418940 /ORGANISM="Scyphosphaera apsteinii, Strain RCC1455" /LENGTH=284 /DNA_ID=CAMNT_0007357051 /DNA_START=1529 /DNA_END=2383 /DNA_ORIENTATION=+
MDVDACCCIGRMATLLIYVLFLVTHAIGSITSPILRFARLWPVLGVMLWVLIVFAGFDHSPHCSSHCKGCASLTDGEFIDKGLNIADVLFLVTHAIGSITSPILRFARLWPVLGVMLWVLIVFAGFDHSPHCSSHCKGCASLTDGEFIDKGLNIAGAFSDNSLMGGKIFTVLVRCTWTVKGNVGEMHPRVAPLRSMKDVAEREDYIFRLEAHNRGEWSACASSGASLGLSGCWVNMCSQSPEGNTRVLPTRVATFEKLEYDDGVDVLRDKVVKESAIVSKAIFQ